VGRFNQMNLKIENAEQECNRCAGKGCQRQGIHHLKVLYANKSGWFCKSCKEILLTEGLVLEVNTNIGDQTTLPKFQSEGEEPSDCKTEGVAPRATMRQANKHSRKQQTRSDAYHSG